VVCRQQARLPSAVIEVWKALDLPAPVAGERMADAGWLVRCSMIPVSTCWPGD
jgi:hypothetical protein